MEHCKETELLKAQTQSVVWKLTIGFEDGSSLAQAISRWLASQLPRFEPRSGHLGFVVVKGALDNVSPEYCGFPCQSLCRLLHTHLVQ
jgi:hypothetical protein